MASGMIVASFQIPWKLCALSSKIPICTFHQRPMAVNANQGPTSVAGPLRITFKGRITALDKKASPKYDYFLHV
jgi:hypothetical protein